MKFGEKKNRIRKPSLIQNGMKLLEHTIKPWETILRTPNSRNSIYSNSPSKLSMPSSKALSSQKASALYNANFSRIQGEIKGILKTLAP